MKNSQSCLLSLSSCELIYFHAWPLLNNSNFLHHHALQLQLNRLGQRLLPLASPTPTFLFYQCLCQYWDSLRAALWSHIYQSQSVIKKQFCFSASSLFCTCIKTARASTRSYLGRTSSAFYTLRSPTDMCMLAIAEATGTQQWKQGLAADLRVWRMKQKLTKR